MGIGDRGEAAVLCYTQMLLEEEKRGCRATGQASMWSSGVVFVMLQQTRWPLKGDGMWWC